MTIGTGYWVAIRYALAVLCLLTVAAGAGLVAGSRETRELRLRLVQVKAETAAVRMERLRLERMCESLIKNNSVRGSQEKKRS